MFGSKVGQRVATELLKVAKDLLGFEFPTQEALDKYLKEHPAADKTLHYVTKTRAPVVPAKPAMSPKTKSQVTPEEDIAYAKAVKSGDKETAEKMVGKAAKEAGYTVGPVWHGTKEQFSVFDLSKAGSNNDTGMWGTGFYFSPDKKMSLAYGGNLKQVFLAIRNPLIIRGNISSLPKELRPAAATHGEAGRAASSALRERMLAAGYDGVIQYEPSDKGLKLGQIVAFGPSQIKSADPFTYRDDGTLIPLSERFDTGSKDIRSSLTESKTFISREILKVAKDLLAMDTPEWVSPSFVGQLDIAGTNLKKYSATYRGVQTWALQSKSKIYKDQYGWVSALWTINPALDGQNWVIESALSFAPATSGSFANQKFAEFKDTVTIAGKKDLAMFGAERHVLTVKPDETNALREVNGVIAQHRDSFNAAKKFWKRQTP
jgi:hypothetical protein